ncbi:MAG: serine hydrolase domain-containing protein [Acidimicrobiales bacterium]
MAVRPAPAVRRRVAAAVVLAVVALVAAVACSGDRPPGGAAGESQIIDDDGARPAPGAGDRLSADDGPPVTYPSVPFSRVDAELEQRVRDDGLRGASLLVVQDGGALHLHSVGSVNPATPVRIGEAGRWFLAVVVAMLVDEGRMALDDPVARQLPSLIGADGDEGRITARHLLAHTSGLPPTLTCGPAPSPSCDDAVRDAPLLASPGEVFRVGPVDDHVLVRLVEAVEGRPWPEVARRRLFTPLGMTATTVLPVADGAAGVVDPSTATTRPGAGVDVVGVDARSTGLDLARFLAFVLSRGLSVDDTRLLSERAVLGLERDETSRLDTADEPWVAWTGIPTYGLGVWRDRLRGDDTASMVSAVGRFGTYPWVDRSRNAYGVLVVEDQAGAGERAVTASARLVQGLVPPAIDTEGRPLRRPGTPVPGAGPAPPDPTVAPPTTG